MGRAHVATGLSPKPSTGITIPFSPLDITGCFVWLDASQEEQNNNELVGNWHDQSGNGYDFIKATDPPKPIFKTGIINGLPALLFDGIDDSLTGITGLGENQPNTMFMVAKLVVAEDDVALFDTAATEERHQLATTAGNFTIFAGTLLQDGPRTTDWFIFTCIFDGASSLIKRNAASASGQAGAHPCNSGIYIGRNWSGAGFPNMYAAEFIMYNNRVSTGDQTKIVDYLKAKYGVSY